MPSLIAEGYFNISFNPGVLQDINVFTMSNNFSFHAIYRYMNDHNKILKINQKITF